MNKLFLAVIAVPALLCGCADKPLTLQQEQMVLELEAAPVRSLIYFEGKQYDRDFAIVCGRAKDGQMIISINQMSTLPIPCNHPAARTTAVDFVRNYGVGIVSHPESAAYEGAIERIIMARVGIPNK